MTEPVDEAQSLVHIGTAPVDVSDTQSILDPDMPDKKAFDPTGTQDFQHQSLIPVDIAVDNSM